MQNLAHIVNNVNVVNRPSHFSVFKIPVELMFGFGWRHCSQYCPSRFVVYSDSFEEWFNL